MPWHWRVPKRKSGIYNVWIEADSEKEARSNVMRLGGDQDQDVKHTTAFDTAWAAWRDTNVYLEPSREAVMLAFSAGFSAAFNLCAEAVEKERLEQARQTKTERLIGIQFAQQAVSLALERS